MSASIVMNKCVCCHLRSPVPQCTCESQCDFSKLTDVRKSSVLVKGREGWVDMPEDSPLMRLVFSGLNSLNPLISVRVAL